MDWSRLPEWLTVEQFYGAESQNKQTFFYKFLIRKLIIALLTFKSSRA